MSNFYDKLRESYWRIWHQITNKIRRWRESTGKNLAQGNVIKAGTYEYKAQEPENPKAEQENETLAGKNQSDEEAMEIAKELLKDQTMQARIDQSVKPNLEQEESVSAEDAWRIAGEWLEAQTKQARVDRTAKQDSEKGNER